MTNALAAGEIAGRRIPLDDIVEEVEPERVFRGPEQRTRIGAARKCQTLECLEIQRSQSGGRAWIGQQAFPLGPGRERVVDRAGRTRGGETPVEGIERAERPPLVGRQPVDGRAVEFQVPARSASARACRCAKWPSR